MSKIALNNGQYADLIVAAASNTGGIFPLPNGQYAQTVVPVGIDGNPIVDDSVKTTGDQSIAGIKTFTNTTPSTSNTTGCATFAGGVGVAGNIFCGGSLNLTNGRLSVNRLVDPTALISINTISNSAAVRSTSFSNHTANHFEALNFAGNIVFSVGNNGEITTASTTPSTSTTTGALLIGGGIGVSGAGYFLNEVSSRSILVGENAVKTSITSTDNGSINEVFIGRQSVGGSILSVPNPVTMGAADNEIRLYRAGSSTSGEYLRLLAPRGGASGQNNIFLFDIVGSSVPSTRPLRFRFINTESGGTTINALQLNPTGRVSINSTADNGVDQLQVTGSTISTQYKLSALNTAPASSTAPGTLGEVRVTATHIFVCTATNTWVRAALSTW